MNFTSPSNLIGGGVSDLFNYLSLKFPAKKSNIHIFIELIFIITSFFNMQILNIC